MTYSQPPASPRHLLDPRKSPAQRRSADTVDAILEGAARILEAHGLDRYNTNDIAERAGVSVGSLYQYFPSKDAITVALIEREAAMLVAEVSAALALAQPGDALAALTGAAVRHQLRRPDLARLLDFEQDRLSAVLPESSSAAAVLSALRDFLTQQERWRLDSPDAVANDIVTIVRALTDAAGRRPAVDATRLKHCIEGAVLGYLAAVERPADNHAGRAA